MNAKESQKKIDSVYILRKETGSEDMALYRNIQMSFWTDPKVEDDYTSDDRYFYLFLMTNPHTNLCGCYEISINQMSKFTGIKSTKKIENLLERMEKVHKNVLYSKRTKELLILRWYKYNWTSSEKFRKPLLKEIQKIKCQEFKEYLMALFNGEDTVSTLDGYGIDTTDSVTVSVSVTDTVSDTVKEIVEYLNLVCSSNYRVNAKNTIKHINARINEGYTVDDFKTVIEKKHKEWDGTSMSQYLTPDTLFGTKFEKYLNQSITSSGRKNIFDEWSES